MGPVRRRFLVRTRCTEVAQSRAPPDPRCAPRSDPHRPRHASPWPAAGSRRGDRRPPRPTAADSPWAMNSSPAVPGRRRAPGRSTPALPRSRRAARRAADGTPALGSRVEELADAAESAATSSPPPAAGAATRPRRTSGACSPSTGSPPWTAWGTTPTSPTPPRRGSRAEVEAEQPRMVAWPTS